MHHLLLAILTFLSMLPLSAQEIPSATPASDPKGILSISETTFNFGTISDGEPVRHSFLVANTGNADLAITTIETPESGASGMRSKKLIKPSENATVSVFFRPEGRSGPVRIKYYIITDTDPIIHEVYLEGEVIPSSALKEEPAPIVSVTEDLFNFGAISYGELITHNFVLRNTGTAPLIIDEIASACRCAAAIWPDTPTAPGDSAIVTVFFSTGVRGYTTPPSFSVQTNAKVAPKRLLLAGKIPYDRLPDTTPPVLEPPLTTIVFEETSFDFGTIIEGDLIEHTFTFTNTGEAPLLIIDTKGSCGCTIPTSSREPIAPGETGKITVVFNSKGKKGHRNQKITIAANTHPAQMPIYLKGVVEPESKRLEIPPLLAPDEEPVPTTLKTTESATALTTTPPTPLSPAAALEDPNCITLFPNPTTDRLQLRMDAPQIGQPALIALFNQSGQLMAQREWGAVDAVVEFDVSNYPAGSYVVRMQVGEFPLETQCFVVKNR